MKTLSILIMTTLLAYCANAQKSDSPSAKKDTEWVLLWGLFGDDVDSRSSLKASEEVKSDLQSEKLNQLDTTKYEVKSIFWGAIQWTEKKEVLE